MIAEHERNGHVFLHGALEAGDLLSSEIGYDVGELVTFARDRARRGLDARLRENELEVQLFAELFFL